MQREWTLIIDLYRRPKDLLLEFNLLDKDRRHRWRAGREVLAEVFQRMVRETAAFFNYALPSHQRMERIEKFRYLADRTFRLTEFLDATDFSPPDALTINTLVTAIPWDLVPYKDEFLGHQVSVGLKIPTARASHPLSGFGEGRPRLLHIVSNPANDLPNVAEELQQLKALIESIQGVDYELVINPTRGELIARFSKSTPFLHFTGHLLPRQGLVLKDGTLNVAEIVTYFPSQRDQFVFLNGCDAVYEVGTEQDSGGLDLFQSASVANAFLDAGVEAVIAPRSRIADDEAHQAAVQIWKLIFEGQDLGEIVRLFRSKTLETRPNAISAYSYVLYGEPSSRFRLPTSVSAPVAGRSETREPDELVSKNEILLEAWRDAGGPVAPRHIFACLTRRWIIAQIYFRLETQSYFISLEELRVQVGVDWPPPPVPAGQIEFTAAGSSVVNRAMSRRSDLALDDLALLEGLALVNDAEVRCALEALERGPRTIEAVLHDAREWNKKGRPVPLAIIEPDGYVNSETFQAGFVGANRDNPATTTVDRWDLFVELIHNSTEAKRMWSKEGLQLPPLGAWNKTQALHWLQFSESLQGTFADVTIMFHNDNTKTVNGGQLMICLTDKEDFLWDDLPPGAKSWLSSQGLDAEKWEALLHKLQREALAWI